MALAWAVDGGGTGSGGSGFTAFIPLVLMFAIFYFLLIRPQQKRQKQHKSLLANLRRGDSVITQGGIHGKITGLTESVITLEIAPGVRVRVSRSFVTGLNTPQQAPQAAPPKEKGKDSKEEKKEAEG